MTTDFIHTYEAAMTHAGDVYADVLTALQAADIPAFITQTGGMCLAIQFPYMDGWFWLTDREDVLSWERNESDGWALGFYTDAYCDGCEPVPFTDTTDVLIDNRKTPETAVRLAIDGVAIVGNRG